MQILLCILIRLTRLLSKSEPIVQMPCERSKRPYEAKRLTIGFQEIPPASCT